MVKVENCHEVKISKCLKITQPLCIKKVSFCKKNHAQYYTKKAFKKKIFYKK